MKKMTFIQKTGTVLLIAFCTGMWAVPLTFAQEDMGEKCLEEGESIRSTVVREILDPSIKPGAPYVTEDGKKIYTCFEKTDCGIKLKKNSLTQDADKPTVECKTELVEKCTSEGLIDEIKGEVGDKQTRCERVQVLIGSGVGLIELYVGLIYKWATGIVGIIAVLVTVFSGIQIATAGGDSGKIDEAKKRIFQSLGGIAILFLSALILYTINPNFFV